MLIERLEKGFALGELKILDEILEVLFVEKVIRAGVEAVCISVLHADEIPQISSQSDLGGDGGILLKVVYHLPLLQLQFLHVHGLDTELEVETETLLVRVLHPATPVQGAFYVAVAGRHDVHFLVLTDFVFLLPLS